MFGVFCLRVEYVGDLGEFVGGEFHTRAAYRQGEAAVCVSTQSDDGLLDLPADLDGAVAKTGRLDAGGDECWLLVDGDRVGHLSASFR